MANMKKKLGKLGEKCRRHVSRRQVPTNKDSGDRSSSRLNAALLYAKVGLPVVPLHGKSMGGGCTCGNSRCKRRGNHPRTANGLQDATTDTGKIKKMWGRWPNAKVAIALGAGVIGVVIEGKAGREALKKLENAK
jgi:Bifunctional DNA primase/polymerase, N-terminal